MRQIFGEVELLRGGGAGGMAGLKELGASEVVGEHCETSRVYLCVRECAALWVHGNVHFIYRLCACVRACV